MVLAQTFSAVVLTHCIEMKQLFVLAHLVVIVIDVNTLLTVLKNWKIFPIYAAPIKKIIYFMIVLKCRL